MTWSYEKYNAETGKVEYLPANDNDGSITGAVRIGLKVWMDENPDVRIAQGWIKHLHYNKKEDPDIYPDYNSQTHYIVTSQAPVDDYTVKDVFHVMEKSEEMLLLQELMRGARGYSNIVADDGTVFIG